MATNDEIGLGFLALLALAGVAAGSSGGSGGGGGGGGGGGSGHPSKKYIMVNLKTWTANNGWDTLKFTTFNDLDVFHVNVKGDGSISYDGTPTPDIATMIMKAHQNNIKINLALGGSGIPSSDENAILTNSQVQQAFITNVMNEVSKGYDGIELDFESPPLDQNGMTNLLMNLSKALHAEGKKLNIIYADRFASQYNLSQIDQYVDNYNCDSSNAPNLPITQNKVNLLLDLKALTDPKAITQRVTDIKNSGYGMYIWAADLITASTWQIIQQNYPIV